MSSRHGSISKVAMPHGGPTETSKLLNNDNYMAMPNLHPNRYNDNGNIYDTQMPLQQDYPISRFLLVIFRFEARCFIRKSFVPAQSGCE